LIRESLERDAELRAVAAACDLRVGTADTYQGDERDLMLFSPVMASGITDGAMAFLSRDANRINVALTRARAALVIVGDKSMCGNGKVAVLSRLVEHVSALGNLVADERLPEAGTSLDYPWVPNPDHVSDYERHLYGALAKAGIFTIPQHGVDQYRLDLALIAPDGRRLDIEVDGERFHLDPWTGERLSRDILRDMRLMEMGWEVRRFWAVEVRDHIDDCVQLVQSWLENKSDPAPAL
jgi:very-short-patch-repair endonuclease